MILLCLALSWLMGCGLVRWLFPASLRSTLHNALVLSLGAGIGIGIASSLYFLTLALVGPRILMLASVEGVALVAALALGILAARRVNVLEWAPGPPTPWYFTAALGVALASAVIIFIFSTLTKPHGEWDAWAIWNMRARFLFRGGEFWRDAFSNQLDWSHPDYPLLLPGIVAMCWTFARAESTLASTAAAFLFTFGVAGVLISTLGILRGKMQALIAGTLLLGGVSLIASGANQYADVPLSYFILTTLGLLCLQDRYPDDLRFSVLAGLTAGFAAWTKNEGTFFLVALIAARAWAISRYGNRATLAPQFLRLAAGLVAPLAVVVFFKLRFAPPNDLLARQPHQILTHLTDISRWITVIQEYIVQPFRIGEYLVPIILVLGVYWYLVRFKVEQRDRPAIATIVIASGVMLAAEFAIYVALPGDPSWQVKSSFDRLLLQLWPSGLLAFFMAANTPQLYAKSKAAEKGKASEKGKAAKRAVRPAAK
jgi:hypothetical protein